MVWRWKGSQKMAFFKVPMIHDFYFLSLPVKTGNNLKKSFFSTYFRVKNCKKHFSYLFKNKSMKYQHDINFDIFLSFLWGLSETIFAKENLSVLRSLSLLFVRRRRPSPSPSLVFSRVHSVLLSQGASVQKYFTSSVIINKAKILITLIESHHETMKLF